MLFIAIYKDFCRFKLLPLNLEIHSFVHDLTYTFRLYISYIKHCYRYWEHSGKWKDFSYILTYTERWISKQIKIIIAYDKEGDKQNNRL